MSRNRKCDVEESAGLSPGNHREILDPWEVLHHSHHVSMVPGLLSSHSSCDPESGSRL